MSRGLRFMSACGPTPSRSMTPGAKFSTTTSALADKSSSRSRPPSDLRFKVMNRLFELSMAKGRMAPPTTARLRMFSPPGGSILITVAPARASRKEQ